MRQLCLTTMLLGIVYIYASLLIPIPYLPGLTISLTGIFSSLSRYPYSCLIFPLSLLLLELISKISSQFT
ncbi:hypothetical protein BC829DRAFT_380399 [Chytridium lagenaria]|nr:hypothetical protein BC829DRAFT_380399 [Chytridium lagenaria]